MAPRSLFSGIHTITDSSTMNMVDFTHMVRLCYMAHLTLRKRLSRMSQTCLSECLSFLWLVTEEAVRESILLAGKKNNSCSVNCLLWPHSKECRQLLGLEWPLADSKQRSAVLMSQVGVNGVPWPGYSPGC